MPSTILCSAFNIHFVFIKGADESGLSPEY